MPADRRTGPVVLLGFDAADPDLVERWAREGKLPAMARLMSRGAWARTSGPELLFEHGIWSTLLLGSLRREAWLSLLLAAGARHATGSS